MQPVERYDLIIQMLSTQEMVTIPELMSKFDVSIETVRRDLNYLEKQQFIKKVYGGAILFNRTGSTFDSSTRLAENASEKAAIGKKCAELIQDGDTVFLGPGTTVMHVAKNLKDHHGLTVVTDSLYVATELIQTDAKVYFTGGLLSNSDASVAQSMDNGIWDYFCPPKAIIGAGGISTKHGVTDYFISDCMALQRFISRATSVIVAADNSKFGLVYSCITTPLSNVNRIVTGSYLKDDILEDFAEYKHRFLFVDDYTVDPGVSSSKRVR